MIWENLAHDKQWYFCGTKFLEVARSVVFVARSGSPLPQPFPQRRRELEILNLKNDNNSGRKKWKTCYNLLKSLNLLNFSLKTENVNKWNFPASPLGD